MVALTQHLGFERFALAGHDRGGRCAYRLALDQPDRVERRALLDIIPTSEMWLRADRTFGMVNHHWFMMAQPYDYPERMLGFDPDRNYFLGDHSIFAPEAFADYLRCIRNPETIHAMCEDYRAGASFDRELDEADKGVRRIQCPLLVLWSKGGELDWWDTP